VFHLLVFDFEKVIVDFNVNEQFNIDNKTIGISGFFQPFCMTCFMEDNDLFFSFFYNHTKTHSHFKYDYVQKKVTSKLSSREIEGCTTKNFPQKCFYSPINKQIDCLYRQGQSVIIKANDLDSFTVDKILDRDLGDIVLWKQRVMIARSSTQIFLFKYVYYDDLERKKWTKYQTIESKGFISINKKINKF